jgi:hypothetical protein
MNAHVIPDINDWKYAFTLHTEYVCKISFRNHTLPTNINIQQTLLLGTQSIGTTLVRSCTTQKSMIVVIRGHLVDAAAGSLARSTKEVLNVRGDVTMRNRKYSQYSQ